MISFFSVPKVDYSKIQNEKCGTMHSSEITSIEIACSCNETTQDGKVILYFTCGLFKSVFALRTFEVLDQNE